MKAVAARAFMALAVCCLGESRRDWALAMQAELDTAIRDGKPLLFAIGCLVAAWREMPRHGEGRFALASHALAIGLLVPMAGLQLACAAGFCALLSGGGASFGAPAPGSAQYLYLGDAYPSALPVLLGLWVWLSSLQLRFAWLLLERDWPAVVRIGSLMAAATATLIIFTGILFLDDARPALQAAALAIELLAVFAAARWHARLCPAAAARQAAG